MTRLIDADALKEAIAKFHQKENERLHTPLWGSIGLNALDRLIDNAPTVEFPFVHVKIKHLRFRECDGWLDKQRQLLFFDFITTEMASKYNWEWEEADNEPNDPEH